MKKLLVLIIRIIFQHNSFKRRPIRNYVGNKEDVEYCSIAHSGDNSEGEKSLFVSVLVLHNRHRYDLGNEYPL